MNCLKCGKETEDTQVFCSDCRQIMDNYPVKPGTAVHIPHRDTAVQEKKTTRRREPTAAETILQQRGMIRWLTVTIAILSVLLCLVAGLLIHTLDVQPPSRPIGQSYPVTGTTP